MLPTKENSMNMQNRWGLRGPARAPRGLSPEKAAASYKLGLLWREEWQKEKLEAASAPKRTPQPTTPPRAGVEEVERRVKFAKAIARAELGRAYWDERLQRGARHTGKKSTGRNPKNRTNASSRS
jgi:hypothetical protein